MSAVVIERIIAATALYLGAPLVTRDRQIQAAAVTTIHQSPVWSAKTARLQLGINPCPSTTLPIATLPLK